MRNVIVSIFPTYKCNRNCNFCYLNKLHNSATLDLDLLKERLYQIKSRFNIHKFNLYGGEITLLDKLYLEKLNSIISEFNAPNYITSNLYDISKLLIFENSYWSTSINVEREDYNYILNTLKNWKYKKIAVLSMITPSIVNSDISNLLHSYNNLNISYLSFIKYYPNKDTGDVFNINQNVYMNTLKNILKVYKSTISDYDYELSLYGDLNECILRRYPIATNDQCIRIGPDGKFGAVYYDNNNLEYFKWYDNLDDYEKDCNIERIRYNHKCGFCPYFGTCWTEHITNLPCDGCKELLDWWKNEQK